MRFKDYMRKKRRKKEMDTLYDPNQTHTTYRDVVPQYFNTVTQPAGGAMSLRMPGGFLGSGDTRDGS